MIVSAPEFGRTVFAARPESADSERVNTAIRSRCRIASVGSGD